METQIGSTLSLEEALGILPEEIRSYVEGLPPDDAARVVSQLLLKFNIEIRPIEEKDLKSIQDRTTESFEFGFKNIDVDLSWEELSRPSYIALGSFAERDGQDVLAAFVVAELCRLPPRGVAELQSGSSAPAWSDDAKVSSSGSSSDAGRTRGDGPIRISPSELRAAMRAVGCRGRDLAVAVWYIGVSYEYRRQGLGSDLLDTVRQIGEAAGAKSMWLHVAEYNPNAIAFYTRAGFTAAPDVYKQGERGRHQLMHLPLTPALVMDPEDLDGPEGGPEDAGPHGMALPAEGGSRGFGGGAGGGPGGSGGAKGKKKAAARKSGKRRALPEPAEAELWAAGALFRTGFGSGASANTAAWLGAASASAGLRLWQRFAARGPQRIGLFALSGLRRPHSCAAGLSGCGLTRRSICAAASSADTRCVATTTARHVAAARAPGMVAPGAVPACRTPGVVGRVAGGGVGRSGGWKRGAGLMAGGGMGRTLMRAV